MNKTASMIFVDIAIGQNTLSLDYKLWCADQESAFSSFAQVCGSPDINFTTFRCLDRCLNHQVQFSLV